MKSATLFLVSMLIIVFTSPSLSTSILTVDDDLVLDYDGNPLRKYVAYDISLPGSWVVGGKVVLSPHVENNTCKADDVVLVRAIPVRGTPFTFTPSNRSEDIKVGSGLGIQSIPSVINPCGYSSVWQVTTRDWPIMSAGGILGLMASCFRIKSQPRSSMPTLYSFEHCRGGCGETGISPISCWPIGTVKSERGEHLSVSESPLWFYFIRSTGPLPSKI